MEFIVIGKPKGKGRPRFSRRTCTVYTPADTTSYEKEIAAEYKEAGGEKFPAGTYVRVQVKAVFPIPKSWSNAKHQAAFDGLLRPDKKPDADNTLKVVLDALNGVAYDDDKQVVYTSCQKVYGIIGLLRITVSEDKV